MSTVTWHLTTPPQCQVIHDEGVIHNDLKPENFVVIGARLKLIDFGIANKIEEEKTSIQRDIRCGTINYMAPETIETYENEDFFKVSLRLPQMDASFPGSSPAFLATYYVTEKLWGVWEQSYGKLWDEILRLQGRPGGGCRMSEDESLVSLVPIKLVICNNIFCALYINQFPGNVKLKTL